MTDSLNRGIDLRKEVDLWLLHQAELDTRSLTRRSIIAGVEGGVGQARAETRTLLDYVGRHRSSEGGSVEAGSLSTKNLSLTLNTASGRSPAGALVFVVRSNNRTSVAQCLFRWVQAQGCTSDTPGVSKNA